MPSDPIIDTIKCGLDNMALQDIRRASDGKAKMGAFILGSCFIEYLAGFRYGKKTTRTDYKNFVEQYLGSFYDAEKLCNDLRCKLVHNYSEGGSYIFVDAKPELHGKKYKNKMLINLENFIDDLEKTMRKLFSEIDSDPTIQALAKKRYAKLGILSVFSIQPN
jgi:hypothetical protein